VIEKNGMLTEDSFSDFDTSKKVKYIEKNGFVVGGEEDKILMEEPIPLQKDTDAK